MKTKSCDIGIIGLGVMGRNFAYNIAEHGFLVSGYDKDNERTILLLKDAKQGRAYGASNLVDFLQSLHTPRKILIFVPAGSPVDTVIAELLPYLENDDVLIDGGNSYFKDTEIRIKMLEKHGVHLIGAGISGGEYGARNGASIMPGGNINAFKQVEEILGSCAAVVDGEPCISYMGPGGAGHYVKMVHNGIEYGVMQLIAEVYDFSRRGLRLTDDEISDLFGKWNGTELSSYLVEITSSIFRKTDSELGKRLIDCILDEAKQKGTGRWMSQDAMELQCPTPIIDAAVNMRNMSVLKEEREQAQHILGGEVFAAGANKMSILENLWKSLYISELLTFSQAMALLCTASKYYKYNFSLEEIIRIWRGGCIIRADFLELFRSVYLEQPSVTNPLLHEKIAGELINRRESLCAVNVEACKCGIPIPAFSAALAYFDAYRSKWLPANLIQAQRDYFGAHTYERVDKQGKFHTEWVHP